MGMLIALRICNPRNIQNRKLSKPPVSSVIIANSNASNKQMENTTSRSIRVENSSIRMSITPMITLTMRQKTKNHCMVRNSVQRTRSASIISGHSIK